ncbi:hypothetical protein DL768_009759 [Monosporascus sp. mg162]|nr:hypothetical protein DL768_009759 [Monosporascus sp. mg162]
MRLSKRLPDFNPPACPQKRIRVTPDQGHIASPHNSLANPQPKSQVDVISRPSSDTEEFLGEHQDVDMSDDSIQAPPFADPSLMDIDEIVEASRQEICYGALCEAYGSLSDSTAGKSLVQDGRHFQQFRIVPNEYSFGLLSEKDEVVAVLDVDTCKTLQCLQGYQGVRATAVVETVRLVQTRVKRSSKGVFPLSINIYGTQDEARSVGDRLSEMHAFLQHPFFLEPGYEYVNPQYFHLGGEMKCMTYLIGLSGIEHRAKRISDEVSRVFDSLDIVDRDDADTALDAQPDAINTPLKTVYNGGVSEFCLASIRMPKRSDFSYCDIDAHVRPGALRIYTFHGSSRPKSAKGVIDHDLVLTTYATLSADCDDLRVLQKVEWYRVVLDEAHWIRNQASNQFRAAESLNAERKWCLTGTPIQNRLNDLESLLKFLHFEPFSRTSIFRRHILEPLSKDTPDRAVSLRALLHTICLRRNEKYLNLPEPLYVDISVELNGKERQVYNSILKKCARDIDEMVSARAKIKKYCILFAAIMKIRRLCNHGTLFVPAQISHSATVPSGTDGEPDCDFCGSSDEDKLALLSKNEFCTGCGRSLSSTSQGHTSKSPGLGSGASTPSCVGDANVDQPGPQSLLSPGQTAKGLTAKGFSTKLLAVVGNLVKSPPGSKRYGGSLL